MLSLSADNLQSIRRSPPASNITVGNKNFCFNHRLRSKTTQIIEYIYIFLRQPSIYYITPLISSILIFISIFPNIASFWRMSYLGRPISDRRLNLIDRKKDERSQRMSRWQNETISFIGGLSIYWVFPLCIAPSYR